MRFGRKPTLYTAATMRGALAAAPHLDALGPPPAASNDYISAVKAAIPSGDWGMLGNDNYGDCVIADDCHYLMLRTANTGRIVIPTTGQALAQYAAVTGFVPTDPSTDQGTDETTDCQYMISTGLLGFKANATAMLDPRKLDYVKWGVQLTGRVRLGIAVTSEMMAQFAAGQPWTATDMSSIEGLHDVPIVGYSGDVFHVVTWGRVVDMMPECYLACCADLVIDGRHAGEAHLELFGDWITSQGLSPSGFRLADLEVDLREAAA